MRQGKYFSCSARGSWLLATGLPPDPIVPRPCPRARRMLPLLPSLQQQLILRTPCRLVHHHLQFHIHTWIYSCRTAATRRRLLATSLGPLHLLPMQGFSSQFISRAHQSCKSVFIQNQWKFRPIKASSSFVRLSYHHPVAPTFGGWVFRHNFQMGDVEIGDDDVKKSRRRDGGGQGGGSDSLSSIQLIQSLILFMLMNGFPKMEAIMVMMMQGRGGDDLSSIVLILVRPDSRSWILL